MPEKTESAWRVSGSSDEIGVGNQVAYLSSTITRQGVVPKGLVWAENWGLVFMITMCECTGSQGGDSEDVGEHDR
jgi:hypothetical protein